jgi:hypothetical protein
MANGQVQDPAASASAQRPGFTCTNGWMHLAAATTPSCWSHQHVSCAEWAPLAQTWHSAHTHGGAPAAMHAPDASLTVHATVTLVFEGEKRTNWQARVSPGPQLSILPQPPYSTTLPPSAMYVLFAYSSSPTAPGQEAGGRQAVNYALGIATCCMSTARWTANTQHGILAKARHTQHMHARESRQTTACLPTTPDWTRHVLQHMSTPTPSPTHPCTYG